MAGAGKGLIKITEVSARQSDRKGGLNLITSLAVGAVRQEGLGESVLGRR